MRTAKAVAAAALLVVLGLAVARANSRTLPRRLDTSQGVASVIENINDLLDKMVFHRHTGTDGSSRLSSPYIAGTVILQSANGSCWSCGPDNAGTWACASTTCPAG